jgi:glycine cleavage system H protein
VELPQKGDRFEKGGEFGTVESVKAVAELLIPISGEILTVNSTLDGSPELVNKDPYGDGWMVEIKPSESDELGTMMIRDTYVQFLKGKK